MQSWLYNSWKKSNLYLGLLHPVDTRFFLKKFLSLGKPRDRNFLRKEIVSTGLT